MNREYRQKGRRSILLWKLFVGRLSPRRFEFSVKIHKYIGANDAHFLNVAFFLSKSFVIGVQGETQFFGTQKVQTLPALAI
jgi:hypothetical protein